MIELSLGMLPGDDAESRVEVVEIAGPARAARVELRQQRYCGELGWVVQKRIGLPAAQAADLQRLLAGVAAAPAADAAPRPPAHRPQLRLVGS